jgi:hypothetical protein
VTLSGYGGGGGGGGGVEEEEEEEEVFQSSAKIIFKLCEEVEDEAKKNKDPKFYATT